MTQYILHNVTDLSEYDWPYSDKCPECHQHTMVDSKCTNCGNSMHQLQCPRCHRWMHHAYLDNRSQCSLICDVEDKRTSEAKEREEYYKDYVDVSTYPIQLRGLAKFMLSEDSFITFERSKEDFIKFLWGIRSIFKGVDECQI